jgi:choline dehydrogenase-like flavoprotein
MRILLSDEGKTATGVDFLQANVAKTLHGRKEIVLSAGTFDSPKLLELSIIGDAKVLHAAGVKVKMMNAHANTIYRTTYYVA